MFVRFRKIPSGGREPRGGVHTKIVCRGGYSGRKCFRCSRKPRCRWHVLFDGEDSPALALYRLQITLIENRRVDGKVKQEHIAHLGEIDGHLLPAFFDGLAPEMADKLKKPEWEYWSLASRVNFWKQCNPQLKRLANRLGPDLQRIRMAIHAQVPWPMQEGVKRLEIFEAERDEEFWRGMAEISVDKMKGLEELIEITKREQAELQQDIMRNTNTALQAATKLAQLKSGAH